MRPLLEVIGGPDHLTYCGPSGAGQVIKGVNQLLMGLVDAAYLEALAYGVRGGVDAATVRQAVLWPGRERGSRGERIARRVVDGQAAQVGVKFRELPYFLRDAAERGVPLPLTQALYDFCDAGERVVIDDNRPAPAFWHELLTRLAKSFASARELPEG
jgi:3-hydroxyisobutyrate dehydrogenase-like beta-hydroxyacid dehydrogenase